MFVFCRNQSRKDASHLETDRIGPRLELFQQPFADEHSFERDQDVAAETFNPAILNGTKPVRVSTLCLEIAEQAWINPSRNHFVSVLQRDSSKSACRNGWVAGERGVATLPRSRSRRQVSGRVSAAQLCNKSAFVFLQALPT